MELTEGLNEAQKEVVLTTEGPLLVLAGAGSGKTKALTHRIAYLIREKGIPAESILAITFTNKAAKEMTERVKKLLGSNSVPAMGTFHSICAKMLRKEAHLLGYPSNFVIFDQDDSLKLIKDIIKKSNLSTDQISPNTVKNYISNAKNELIDESAYENYASSYKEGFVVEVYRKYQKELAKNEAMDFDDLLFNVVKILEKYPQVLEKYQKIWHYILIDEYQDTNQAQYLFAKLLSGKNQNICVVGDDWQSIYSWRGANFQNILNFEKDYPNAKVIKLEQNYRSTKAILAAAQSVIERNQNRSNKTIWTDNESGSPINIYEARNESDEGAFVCREALNLNAKGCRFSDMAVFYRTNAQSRTLEEQLLRYKIPYKIVGGVRFYERKEIKDILAWIRVASGANDFISFERSLSNPPSGIGKVSLGKLKDICDLRNIKISDLVLLDGEIAPKTKNALLSYFEKIEKIKRAATESVSAGIEKAIKVSGLAEYLSDGTFQGEERVENLKELISVAAEYEKIKGSLTLPEFLEEVALISDIDNYQDKEEGITLMTLHTSKGLEFKTVFIVGLEENIFPHSRSALDLSELEEERRLFYVGLTRARERAFLVFAKSRLYFGNIQANPPSRFIAEIPESLISYFGESSLSGVVKVEEERIPGQIKAGDKIEHENFGVGDVISAVDDELLVFFPNYGEKIISVYYAPIKKIA